MDLLIRGGQLLTLADDMVEPFHSDLAIVDGVIAGIAPYDDLEASFGPPVDVLEATGRYLLPGFVNAHTHLFQSAFRGLGAGLRLEEWRAALLVPIYPHLTPDDIYWFTLLGALENVQAGVTTVVNLQAWPYDLSTNESVAHAIAESGLRALIVKTFGGRAYSGTPTDPTSWGREVAEVFEKLDGGFAGRIRVAAGPSRPAYSSAEGLHEAHEVARSFGSGIHTHVAETPEGAAADSAKLGMSETRYLDSSGVLDSRFQGAHCVAIDQTDANILAERGATSVHCPIANMYLGSGIADLEMQLAAGINVALGTDGPASNNNQDMIGVMKTASLLQKAVRQDASVCPPLEVLRMATRNGARSVGVDAGTIEVGARADLTVMNLEGLHNQPLHDPLAAIVYSAHADDIESVIVDGQIVMCKRVFRDCDPDLVLREAASRARALLARAGI
jgi:5-methylthioadenosine/S-adenosylhomocysteine deaminase